MLDVIEIDGASNRGINEAKALIEKARFEPNQWKYKIYIIDEVHMLTTEAFNALLKSIEEPPEHVKFILATTEIDKVPETIRSRAQKFDFHKIPEEAIIQRLEYVINAENIDAEKEAIQIIARASRWGLRDALTLLEQNTINKKLSTNSVESGLSLLEQDFLEEILEALKNADIGKIMNYRKKLSEKNLDTRTFFDQMIYTLRDKMILHLEWPEFSQYEDIFRIFQENYKSIRFMPDGFLLIEITLMQSVRQGKHQQINEEKTFTTEQKNPAISQSPQEKSQTHQVQETWTIPQTSNPEISKKITANHPTQEQWEPKHSSETPSTQNPLHDTTVNVAPEKEVFSYRSLLGYMKDHPVIVAALKTASFSESNNHLKLFLTNNWHITKLNEPKHQNILIETLETYFWEIWTLEIILGNHSQKEVLDDIF